MKLENATKYVILIFVGFCGMLVCHFFILLLLGYGDAVGKYVPFYAFTYPVIYGIFAFILSRRNREHGVTNSLALCAVPTIYWFGLLIYDGKLSLLRFSFYDSSGMIVIMPMTICVAMAVMLLSSKTKHEHH
jgi:hypothetical protein